MRVVVGGSLTWRQRKFSVLFIEKDSAMLRDEDGSEVEVALDELRHDATPVPSDTSGLLNLSLQVQDITPDMDPWLQSCIRIEATREEIGVGKAVEAEREWLEVRLSSTALTRSSLFRVRVGVGAQPVAFLLLYLPYDNGGGDHRGTYDSNGDDERDRD